MGAVFCVVGMLCFCIGALLWGHGGRYQNPPRLWTDPLGAALGAGGLALLVAGLAMLPGW